MNLDAVFKAYDIRGLVPDELNTDLARQVGGAFARFSQSKTVLVGRDMRPSGLELSGAFIDGVLDQGCDVVDLGLIPTDLLYFAAGNMNLPGATFTGSHNPAQYNGIKLCLPGAKPVGEDTGLDVIKADIASGTAPPVSAVDWVGAVRAVTAPAAGARTNPVTAHTTAKRPAVPARTDGSRSASSTTSSPRPPAHHRRHSRPYGCNRC